MRVPDISSLSLHDTGPSPRPTIPDDMLQSDDRYIQKLRNYALSVPYPVESNARMQELLDFILTRMAQCVQAKDYDPGFLHWDAMFGYWSMLKYPIPKEKRIKLIRFYFHLATTPGMPTSIISICSGSLQWLARSRKKLSIEDLRLPWKPIYQLLSKDLFLTRRQFEYSSLSFYMGYIADHTRRFFHPAAIDEMLATFVPLVNGTDLDSILSSQYYMLTFLPLTHPQSYLPMLFRMWESINSYMYDERMLHFLSRLAEMHVDPSVSDPAKIEELPDDEKSDGEGRPNWPKDDLGTSTGRHGGLYKDVGIFTEHEWQLLMCKCLASMEIPLADAGSLTTGPSADNEARFEITRLPKARWRIQSLACIIVYSMAPDGLPAPASTAPTPLFTPLQSGTNTPQIQTSTLADFLAAPIGKKSSSRGKTYLAGSKALDSLARLIASTESFFHPSNSGDWTADLSAFIKYIVYYFNERWHKEQEPDCTTPTDRRLTRQMKRELVKSLRTVALLAMFSQDSTTVSNIQSCMKSMSEMEPDLILHPVLERAVPSLEALVETQRTTAVIKALGAVVPAIVSRDIYYPGAKHLVPILHLLIPGIDLNDPSKTLCTTSFLIEVSQYIKFGDLTSLDAPMSATLDTEPIEPASPPNGAPTMPTLSPHELNELIDGVEPRLSDEDEDAILRDTTGDFADWVAKFIRRVIQLLENLPEEGSDGATGGTSEAQIVSAVTCACSQICVHLSESLFDLALNMVFDYASTNVRSNAVRGMHELVGCLSNANPEKTVTKFFSFCFRNIQVELENGASSLRTTMSSLPLPSDATLHWNLALLRGCVYNDGRALLPFKEDFLSLFSLLHNKTLSKRGFSWSGKLLASTLLTLTHTYPLDNKFVNPDEWASDEFRWNHHKRWGKLYKPDEVKLTWHVPNVEEIDFTLQIFKELIEPTLATLDALLDNRIARDAVWRNDFCRHLSLVRDAFSGIPTLVKEIIPEHLRSASTETSDTLNELAEMIPSVDPLNSGFCLTDPEDARYQYITSLRRRFGDFLHRASVSLRQQGEENTVDAVRMLIRALRTYMLDYGDSKDSYSANVDQYSSELDVARLYANQKVWPRALYTRRARLHHSARLRWNSVERLRGPLEDSLIDDLVEWSMWNYATVREAAQSLIEAMCSVYDGIRTRALPVLYKALLPGTEDDRMKGALWTLNYPVFAKYAVSEPTLATDLLKHLFKSQHNEKPSIQGCVSVVSENCLGNFVEPCYLVYDIENVSLAKASRDLMDHPSSTECISLVRRCQAKRVARLQFVNDAIQQTTTLLLDIAQSPRTHWRYSIVAIRCLRTLLRRDVPPSPAHMRYFLKMTHDSHPSIRYYAQRGIMKASRNIKLRTLCHTPSDLVQALCRNPLKCSLSVEPLHTLTTKFLKGFKIPPNIQQREPLYCDKISSGWLAWSSTLELFLPPYPIKSTFQPWEPTSESVVAVFREAATDASYWTSLSTYLSEENHENGVTDDNIANVKSIFQILDDAPFEALRPTLEMLLQSKEKDKQRAAAELLAGVIGGSKHWPTNAQQKLWSWITPFIKKVLGQNIKPDTSLVWSTFLEYVFHHTDPRRVQPLATYLMEEFLATDYNSELSFDATKIISLFESFYQELGWKFSAWTDTTVERCWSEIHGEHDTVRASVGDILAFSDTVKWCPRPSKPVAGVFVRECRTSPLDFDIMGMHGTYHMGRVLKLVNQFKTWRAERIPGVRAFQSTYDRVGITVCKWLFQLIHHTRAISAYDYILPLVPELFRFTEVNDNDELVSAANVLLVRMCGVTPPRSLVDPMLDAIFESIRKSSSWRVRLKALPLVQVFYFRQMPLISESKVIEILEVLSRCLDDEIVEVREMAATTLSGIIRLSPKRSVITLKDRFVRLAKNSRIPPRQSASYTKAIRQRHAALLGLCALVDSYPYTVETWMPELLTDVLANHTYDPMPISTTMPNALRDS
ncbi:hypothetical protein PLICRDRAFT_694576 [Plicaturopsis crispa FD-325 SS-3]|nr:hypothetical protein PLICRDRAFT_694576 [Plicaturopsis crispa FD-325 SS-3]